MEFTEVVRRRRMVRSFSDEAVDPAVIETALAHAVRAPSAGFTQGWAFLVLDTPEQVAAFWAATTDPDRAPDRWLTGMRTAPVLIVPCSSKAAYLGRYAEPDKGWTDLEESRWPVPYWHVDTGMASLLILQTAVDHGLGGCFFGIPPTAGPAVRETFAIAPEFDPVGVIALGHPATGGAAGSPTRRRRKPLTEVVHRGSWGH